MSAAGLLQVFGAEDEEDVVVDMAAAKTVEVMDNVSRGRRNGFDGKRLLG